MHFSFGSHRHQRRMPDVPTRYAESDIERSIENSAVIRYLRYFNGVARLGAIMRPPQFSNRCRSPLGLFFGSVICY